MKVGLDGYKKDTKESFKDFFTISNDIRDEFIKRTDTASANYFDLFATEGKDLSMYPSVSLPKESREQIARDYRSGDCHNFTRAVFYNFCTKHAFCKPQLYYGYVECYNKDVYLGMFCHSFMTYEVDGMRTVFDMMLIAEAFKCPGVLTTSHYGIRLPYSLVIGLNPINYSGYIKDMICPSKQKTQNFISKLKQFKDYDVL